VLLDDTIATLFRVPNRVLHASFVGCMQTDDLEPAGPELR
jgi:hypothetical protein